MGIVCLVISVVLALIVALFYYNGLNKGFVLKLRQGDFVVLPFYDLVSTKMDSNCTPFVDAGSLMSFND